MKSKIKILDYCFIRLPVISIDNYLNISSLSMAEGLLIIKESAELEPFRNLLKEHNTYLYDSIIRNKVNKKTYLSILNYLMRASSRFSPYKNFSTISRLNLGESNSYQFNNDLSFKQKESTPSDDVIFYVVNKNLRVLNDCVIYERNSEVVKIYDSKIVNFIKNFKETKIIKLNSFMKKLLKIDLLQEVSSRSLFNVEGTISERCSVSVDLKETSIDRSDLEKVAKSLSVLLSLNGNEVNKSIHWINRIREYLFNNYGTSPVNLLSINLGEKVFREDLGFLLNETQTKLNKTRIYFLEKLNGFDHAQGENLVLTEKDLELINKNSYRVPINLSSCFNVIFKKFSTSDYLGQIGYCRSSFRGVRTLSEHIVEPPGDEIGVDNVVFVDILYSSRIKHRVLLKRARSTNYYLSLDNTPGLNDQEQVYIEDLYLYSSTNEVVLFSKKLNKRVIPVITTTYLAENSENTLYRFFAAMSKNYFNDGLHLDLFWTKRKTIPRIVFEDLIISPKTWIVSNKQLATIVSDLPELVRVVSGDKDALYKSNSPFFLELACKGTDDDLIIQEDLSLYTSITTKDKSRYLNEIVFNFERELILPKIPFKNYETVINSFDDKIIELRIFAPVNYLDEIMTYLIRNYLDGKDYFFIFYQIPNSQIRLRLDSDMETADKIVKNLLTLSEFCISSIVKNPYEYETSTYDGIEGVEVYLSYSKLMSKKWIELKKLSRDSAFNKKSVFGPVFEILYLSILSSIIFDYKEIDESYDFDLDIKYTKFKELKEMYFELKNKKNASYLKLLEKAKIDSISIVDIIKQWDSKVEKSVTFFKHRIIHMEIFRLTNGEYSESNKFVLKFAKEILKNEKYGK